MSSKEKKIVLTKEEKELLEELWNSIREKRKELNLTQADLSEKTWIDRSYISMLERWETNITYLKLKKIWDVLEINLVI